MHSTPNLRGIIYMVLAATTFVSGDAFLKMMLAHVPPMQSLAMRGVAGAVWCFVALVAMGQLRHLPRVLEPWTMLRTLAEVAAVSCFIVALATVPIATITAIYQTAPLLVLVGASLLWGERIGAVRWVLIAVGLAGALLVAQPGQDGASPLAPRDTPGMVVAFGVIIAVLLVSLLSNQIFETWSPTTPRLWAYAAGAGFFVMLGQVFVFLSFRHASARAVAPFYYCFTLVAAVIGVVFFNEYPNTLAMAGFALIIVCGLGVLYFENEKAVS
jgi:drug/metabolite transporter (DMT)-like permease